MKCEQTPDMAEADFRYRDATRSTLPGHDVRWGPSSQNEPGNAGRFDSFLERFQSVRLKLASLPSPKRWSSVSGQDARSS